MSVGVGGTGLVDDSVVGVGMVGPTTGVLVETAGVVVVETGVVVRMGEVEPNATEGSSTGIG